MEYEAHTCGFSDIFTLHNKYNIIIYVKTSNFLLSSFLKTMIILIKIIFFILFATFWCLLGEMKIHGNPFLNQYLEELISICQVLW